MKKQWKRLLIAALTSSSVFAATWYWYQSSAEKFTNNSNEKPLAYVGSVIEDIQRRPASRLLWQLVNTGEPLFDGEAIRTGEKGEVRIQFADSDRYLDLEPESLIVIKKSAGEISLDLMEGSLFVNANNGTAADGSSLVLNSAQGKVDLSKASASLSKGQGGAIDVQVLEGRASLQNSSGAEQELGAKTQIKIISPPPQKPVAMNAESLQPVAFEWDGFPPQTRVSLWAGSSRRKMQEIKKADLNQKHLKAPLAFGRHYWKLVGTSPQGEVVAETPVYRTDVEARYAPTVVFPTADAQIIKEILPAEVEFRWQKGEDTRQTTLEIWADPELKKKLVTQNFTTQESFTTSNLPSGTYYWRMSSLFNDAQMPLAGKIQKFMLATEKDLRPVLVPVQVQLTSPETQYFVTQPQLDLNWKVDKSDQVSSWRISIRNEKDAPETARTFESKNLHFTTPMQKPGRYIASIEAVAKSGEVLGTVSSPLSVLPKPLLEAPVFLPRQGDLRADMSGRTQLQWTALPDAKEYWLVIKKDGKELKRSKYRSTGTSLKNLLPGEYEVEILATDDHGRVGEKSAPRRLIVPDSSGLKAPTLKKIKVN